MSVIAQADSMVWITFMANMKPKSIITVGKYHKFIPFFLYTLYDQTYSIWSPLTLHPYYFFLPQTKTQSYKTIILYAVDLKLPFTGTKMPKLFPAWKCPCAQINSDSDNPDLNLTEDIWD